MSEVINGRYLLHETLGQGGMGIVHRATDRLTGDIVALKQVFLPVEQLFFASRPASQTSRELRLALTNEFQILASLRHPNIISVLDYGFDEEGRPFYTMSYFNEAVTILEAGNGRSLSEKVDLLLQTLEALAYLHRRGILHRDLKPDNVLVVDNTVRVLDFGLAAAKEQATESVGSSLFLSPEVLLGGFASEASDLYALGVLAYWLLAGRYPFNLRADDLMTHIVAHEPDWALLPQEMELTAVVQKLLAKTVNGRFASAREAATALRQTATSTTTILPDEQAIRESYLQAAKFVGREAEMAQLQTVLAAAKAGQGSAWLIGGESGVGKSRLLRELQTQALVAGFLVMRGQAVADNGGLPYQIWREPLRHLLLAAAEVDDATASALLPLVPDVASLLGQTVEPLPKLEEQAMQQRLFAAIIKLFDQQERPLLLLTEDLHWAVESLVLFPQLVAGIATKSWLIVGTYRSDEWPQIPQQLADMTLLSLPRLSETAVSQLSQSMLGQKIGKRPDLLALLQKETEGNAFFLVEMVRALAEEAGRLDAVGQEPLPATLLPAGIQAIIGRRLSRIPQAGQPLLRLTAVAGRELDLDLVSLLHNAPLDAWLAACAEAMVLEVQNGRWLFAHDKIREAVLAAMSPAVRQASHEQVAHALETLYADRRDYAAQLAHHWQQANNLAKERSYAVAAAELATEQYRNREALTFLERVYALTPAADLVGRLHCLLAQEKIYYFLGNRTLQGAKLTEMLALAKQLGDANLLAEVMFRRSIYAFATGDIPQALNSTHIALEQAQIANNIAVQGLANRALGNVFTARGLVQEAAHYFELSLALHKQENDSLCMAVSSINAGAINTHMGHHIRARTLLSQAIELLEGLGEQQYLSTCFSFRAYDNSRRGDLLAAQADGERGIALAQATNYKAGLGMAYLGAGMAAFAAGALAEAASLFDEAVLWLGESDDHFYRGIALRTAGQVALQRGRVEAARGCFRASLQLFGAMGNAGEVAMNRMGLAATGEAVEGHLTAVFAYLQANPYFVATANPFTVYLQAYHCLVTLGDSRALHMIKEAHALLQERAAQFTDLAQRALYLTALAEHREIVDLYQGLGLK